MARLNPEVHLRPSILDRLLDDEPEVPREPLHACRQSLPQAQRAVMHDLEALLNTRQEVLEELPEEFAEVHHSLVMYGLPDFTSLSFLSPHDHHRIRRAVEQAIATFESRLTRVRVTLEPPQEHERSLHFRVDALLHLKPAPEPVTFDAVLHLHTLRYTVRGRK